MTQFTPTTEGVSLAAPKEVLGAEFDRWLTRHDAETAAKALEDAADAVDNAERIAGADHPNRSDVTEWLRARADVIRTQQEGTE